MFSREHISWIVEDIFRTEIVKQRKDFFTKPPIEVPRKIKELTNITDSQLRDARPFKDCVQELKEFIRANFKTDKSVSEKISVTKNNFTFVFQKWSNVVKPTISVDWEKVKKAGIIAADFFLADLRAKQKLLEEKIEAVVYKYGFLR